MKTITMSDASRIAHSTHGRVTKPVDPLQIFLHADGFFKAGRILRSVQSNQTAMEVAQPVMVLAALTIELFLKCIVCIETGVVPRGHRLDELFAQLSEPTRGRIEQLWNTELLPRREGFFANVEKNLGYKIPRDLSGALASGSRAFEKIRYSYENDNEGLNFYVEDLTGILGRMILEKKPKWKNIQRNVTSIENAKPTND
jgi:hypothetical protein